MLSMFSLIGVSQRLPQTLGNGKSYRTRRILFHLQRLSFGCDCHLESINRAIPATAKQISLVSNSSGWRSSRLLFI